MNISHKTYNLIKEFEGFSSKPYLCPGNYKTIGYGHMLNTNDQRSEITREEAEGLLEEDILNIENSVLRNINISLTQGQFDALVSFTFNVGSAALQRSTLRQKVNRGEHAEVPKEFMRWIFANGKKVLGLINRRVVEASLYQT